MSKEIINDQLLIHYDNDNNIEKKNALKFARKKQLLNDSKDYEKKLSKMARAGFSYEISKAILKSSNFLNGFYLLII